MNYIELSKLVRDLQKKIKKLCKICKILPDDSEKKYGSESFPVENHISDDIIRPVNENQEFRSLWIHLRLQKTQYCHADRSVPAISRFFHP